MTSGTKRLSLPPPALPGTGTGVLIGYARVSTEDQKLDLQRDALAQLGCHRVFEDRASGARTPPAPAPTGPGWLPPSPTFAAATPSSSGGLTGSAAPPTSSSTC